MLHTASYAVKLFFSKITVANYTVESSKHVSGTSYPYYSG
jgi:hypothetical protein